MTQAHNDITALVARLKAVFTLGQTKGSGRKSKKSFEEVASTMGLNSALNAEFARNPVQTYMALAQVRRDMDALEAAAVLASPEAEYQGMLPCGEPAQSELFIQSHIRVTDHDAFGQAFILEASRMAKLGATLAKCEGRTIYLRYKANAVVRSMRGDGRTGLRARYGGRFYLSDSANHSGVTIGVYAPPTGLETPAPVSATFEDALA